MHKFSLVSHLSPPTHVLPAEGQPTGIFVCEGCFRHGGVGFFVVVVSVIKHYVRGYVCTCVRARARARACVCVCVCV